VNKKQNTEINSSAPEAKGIQGTLAFLDLRLGQHYQFLAVAFIFFLANE
jgi:hypothetical protein